MELERQTEPVAKPGASKAATRVAIVEDQPGVAESLKKLLAQMGMQVVAAFQDGETALAQIPKLAPDVVLMDIGLPGLSGIECVRQLKTLMPTLPIIMLTVYDDGEHLFDSLKAGASGYLLKRTTPEKLAEAMVEATLGGVPLTRKMANKVAGYFQQLGAANSEVASLSRREREVLVLLAEGFRYKEIADRLGIAIVTVREHVCNTYRKLHVSSRTEAVVKYLKK